MATPHELLASSLLVLKEAQESSINIFKTSAFHAFIVSGF